jgi:hypothetical protein
MLEKYGAILQTIQGLCPTAHIAGGAVRDTVLDRPIKDIDLFLDDSETESAAQLLRARFGYVKVGEWVQYMGFSDPMITHLAIEDLAREHSFRRDWDWCSDTLLGSRPSMLSNLLKPKQR